MKTITNYTHPAPASEQAPDPAPGNYYVSIRDGTRTGLLLGPFERHADALAQVEPARAMANKLNVWATFYSFGTVKMKDDFRRPGTLNDRFPDLFTKMNLPAPTRSAYDSAA